MTDHYNEYVKDIDPGIWYQIQLLLTIDDRWEKLLNVSPIRQEFTSHVEKLKNVTHLNPVKIFLDYCLNRPVYTKDFINWLEKLNLEDTLYLLKKDEPLKIIEKPGKIIEITAGPNKKISLLCRAQGFPTPKYQWYHNDQVICKSPILEISPVTVENSGLYHCCVYNISRSGIANYIIASETNVIVYPSENNIPEIVKQPCNLTIQVNPGSSYTLSCEAQSKYPVSYQWCCNRIILAGETSSKINISFHPNDNQGKFIECLVSNEYGYVWSNKVIFELNDNEEQYNATDKFALLIGINEYKYFDNLSQTTEDVCTLVPLLESIGFKTFAFQNLTQKELINAVKLFCTFLRNGIYALFYFAGHGYGTGHLQTYLVPKDAKSLIPEQSVCAEYILKCMQEKSPTFNIILLDVCRNLPVKGEARLYSEKIFKPKVLRNTIFGYATSFLCSSYEMKNKNSIFVHYLKKHLTEHISVWNLLLKVLRDIENDTLASEIQYPSIAGNLSRPLKLTDKINGKGELYEKHSKYWTRLTSSPKEIRNTLQNLGITTTIRFEKYQNIFCNVLTVHLYVTVIPEYSHILLNRCNLVLEFTNVRSKVNKKVCEGKRLYWNISLFDFKYQKNGILNGILKISHDGKIYSEQLNVEISRITNILQNNTAKNYKK